MNENDHSIAIVGMSLRFPGASTLDQFWQNLVEGKDCARVLDKDELLKVGVKKEKLDNPEYVYRAYDLPDMGMFDPKFFGISPREAKLADPQLRVMLECTYECIQESGHVLNGTNTGLYFGSADHKYWMYYNLFQSPLESPNEVAKRIFTVKDFFNTQISHKLGLNGPSFSLSSACSSGLLAVHEACNHLMMYDCDFALAGGCEILKNYGYLYAEGGLSARDGTIRAFDSKASGTIFGSGGGVVLLRRLSDALEDGDHIYGVIRSTAVNNDGNRKVGYTAPGVQGQMDVIEEALNRAELNPRDISYVEAHGTGTPVGDPIEIESLSKSYKKYTKDKQFCPIGSVKTNVGHLSIAAGIAGLIKTSLMLHHKKIPASLHFEEPNPAIDFENSPFYVNTELQDWHCETPVRYAGVSAFGIGGTNTHVILEEYVPEEEKKGRGIYDNIVAYSAKSEAALTEVKQRTVDYLKDKPETALNDLAYTMNVGREHFNFRSFVRANDTADVVSQIESNNKFNKLVSNREAQTIFMFPGQGSQYINMGRSLYEKEPVFRAVVDQCRELAKAHLDVDLIDVLYPQESDLEEATARINRTEFTQLGLFVVSYSMAKLWEHWGVRPQAMIGHSIGEYVAACIGGVFSLEDALKLVIHRGRLMQSMRAGSMLSVPLPQEQAKAYLNDDLSIAVVNSPAATVIAGETPAIEALQAKLEGEGINSTVLKTSHAFHSVMMEPMLAEYQEIVASVNLQPAKVPYVSNVSGDWISNAQSTSPEYWVSQLRGAVQFSRGIETLARLGSTIFIEVGPGAALSTLVAQHDFSEMPTIVRTMPKPKDKLSDVDTLLDAMGNAWSNGINIDWEAVYGDNHGMRLSLPTYPFQRSLYWFDEESLDYWWGGETAFNLTQTQATESSSNQHPLLGQRVVQSDKAVVYEVIIDKDSTDFVKDHRLVETVIFPGAGYTQMALALGKSFVKNKKLKVDDIRFAQTMMLHEGVRKVVQVIGTASGDGCTFEIISRTEGKSDPDDASAWVLHAKGRLSAHSEAPQAFEMPDLINQPETELVPLDKYYEALKFITFGPSFRTIKRFWIGENEEGTPHSLGLVELPKHLEGDIDQYSFHPVLIDAAFQIIDGIQVSETGTLPVGLRNFVIYDKIPNRFYVTALRQKSEEEEYSIGEVVIFSEEGYVLARIEHYLQKGITEISDVSDKLGDCLYDMNWRKVDEIENPEHEKGEQSVVLVGGESGTRDALVKLLEPESKSLMSLNGHLVVDGDDAVDEQVQATEAYQQDKALSEKLVPMLQGGQVDEIVYLSALSGEPKAFDLSMELIQLLQGLAKLDLDSPPRVTLVTQYAQGSTPAEGTDVNEAHQATVWGIGNSLSVEHPEFNCSRVDLDGSEASLAAFVEDMTLKGKSDQIAYREGERFMPRLHQYNSGEVQNKTLSIADGPYEVKLDNFGTFDNFAAREFIPDLVEHDEVQVEMYSASVNFKETLWALGILNPNNRDAMDFDFGVEGAGKVKRVGEGVKHVKKGDDVIVWHDGCLTSDFVVKGEKVVKMPESLSYAEASTIPTVYMTALHALKYLANIKAGDKVLVHAAAGGVGQVAVQIAQAVGAEVFATASPAKWDYLKSMGVNHIYNSRNLDFVEQLLSDTDDKGVDIVLNSLAGDFIQSGFDVLAQNGSFIEIGKNNIWTLEQAKAYREDVNYHHFELGEDKVSGGIGGRSVIADLMNEVLAGFESGDYKPMPIKSFPITELTSAFRLVSSGKNIGKAVLDLKDRGEGNTLENIVSAEKTYLITGGLGALGFLTAKWLIEHGAKHLVLTGRSKPKGDVAKEMEALNAQGIDIRAAQGDVTLLEDVQRIVADIDATDAPLGGIMHCAGVLADAVITQQSAEKFTTSFNPKVEGTLNLHNCTKDMNLDLFVCFSSVSAIFDGGGQANYAAANSFMDRLMASRRSQGLAGLSVNWGAWADVGMAADLADKRSASIESFITQEEAFLALGQLVVDGRIQGTVCKLGNRLDQSTSSSILFDLVENKKTNDEELSELEQVFASNAGNSVEENMALFIKNQVNKVLGASSDDEFDMDAEFVDLGVDSLSMAELKNAIQQGLGKTLKMATFFANSSTARLASYLGTEEADTIQSKLGNTVASPAKEEEDSTIDFVAIADDAAEGAQNLFCFPGLNGNIFDYSDFAEENKQKYQVFVGEISNDISKLETDIRKIAAAAIAKMKALQETGPYALVGYSFGGVVSLEIAHQLKQAGDEVEFLLMIDSFPHFDFKGDEQFIDFMNALIVDSILIPMSLDEATYDLYAEKLLDSSIDEVGDFFNDLAKEKSGRSEVNLKLLDDIIEAGLARQEAEYVPPQSLEGINAHYLQASEYARVMDRTDIKQFLDTSAMSEEAYGWTKYFSNELNISRLGGQHNTLLKGDSAKQVTRVIDGLLTNKKS